MTVASAENNETNVRIYWKSSTNAKSCECTIETEGIVEKGALPFWGDSSATGKDGQETILN